MWALGNYSRFIRPGARRVFVEDSVNSEIKISAYKNTNNKLVIVCINKGENDTNIQMSLKGKSNVYETSETKSLALLGTVDLKEPISLPANSIFQVRQ